MAICLSEEHPARGRTRHWGQPVTGGTVSPPITALRSGLLTRVVSRNRVEVPELDGVSAAPRVQPDWGACMGVAPSEVAFEGVEIRSVVSGGAFPRGAVRARRDV